MHSSLSNQLLRTLSFPESTQQREPPADWHKLDTRPPKKWGLKMGGRGLLFRTHFCMLPSVGLIAGFDPQCERGLDLSPFLVITVCLFKL